MEATTKIMFIQLQDKKEWQIPGKNKDHLAKEILFLSNRS